MIPQAVTFLRVAVQALEQPIRLTPVEHVEVLVQDMNACMIEALFQFGDALRISDVENLAWPEFHVVRYQIVDPETKPWGIECAIYDAIGKAERILQKIDERWSLRNSDHALVAPRKVPISSLTDAARIVTSRFLCRQRVRPSWLGCAVLQQRAITHRSRGCHRRAEIHRDAMRSQVGTHVSQISDTAVLSLPALRF